MMNDEVVGVHDSDDNNESVNDDGAVLALMMIKIKVIIMITVNNDNNIIHTI